MAGIANRLSHPGLGWALAAFLGTRILIWIVAYASAPDPTLTVPGRWQTDVPLVRWDSGHYRYVYDHGYPAGPDVPAVVAVFPLYPLLARSLTPLLPRDVALVVLANVAALLGIAFLYAWSKRLTDARTALLTVLLAAAYPPAMFLSAGYTEGLFFLEVVATLWLLGRGRTMTAAAVCGIATATRPTGLILAAVVALWTWFHGQPSASSPGPSTSVARRVLRLAMVVCVSISGIAAYQAYLCQRYGRPDAYFVAQRNWRSQEVNHPWLKALTLQPVWEPAFRPIKYALRGDLDRLRQPRSWNPLLSLLMLVVGIKGLIRPGPIPRALFALPVGIFLMTYLPDPGGGSYLVCLARYQLVSMPCFLLLAAWRPLAERRMMLCATLAGLLALQCLYASTFANWEWAG